MNKLEIMQKGNSFEQLKEYIVFMIRGEDIASK